jgi:hypothetical protein
MGYETYMARWKKPGNELEILVPATRTSCVMKTTMTMGVAYHTHNGNLEQEPTVEFEKWMQKHRYDPEHGFNIPEGSGTATADGGTAQ